MMDSSVLFVNVERLPSDVTEHKTRVW